MICDPPKALGTWQDGAHRKGISLGDTPYLRFPSVTLSAGQRNAMQHLGPRSGGSLLGGSVIGQWISLGQRIEPDGSSRCTGYGLAEGTWKPERTTLGALRKERREWLRRHGRTS